MGRWTPGNQKFTQKNETIIKSKKSKNKQRNPTQTRPGTRSLLWERVSYARLDFLDFLDPVVCGESAPDLMF